MKKHKILGVFVLIMITTPFLVNAACVEPYCTRTSNTFPFGGRVLTTTLPTVTCLPPGTGPVVLISNVVSLGSAVYSGVNRQQSDFERASGVVSGIYNTLPFYTTDPAKSPRPGQWVLGRHEIVPDIKTCLSDALGGFPVPVKRTTIYGVSGNAWSKK